MTYKLAQDLEPGDRIRIASESGWHTYQVMKAPRTSTTFSFLTEVQVADEDGSPDKIIFMTGQRIELADEVQS